MNFIKPQYSSFKMAGVQVRGRKAAYAQIIVMLMLLIGWLLVLGFRLIAFLSWMIYLGGTFSFDLVKGFVKGARAAGIQNLDA